MAKSLSQIALFDFPVEEEDVELTAPKPPLVIVVDEERKLQEEPIAIVADEVKEPVVEMKNEKKPSTRGRRSLKDIGVKADLINIPEDEILFQKQYYSIGEVATMFRENQSLIRYWETEFDILQPRKNRKGDRFFRPIDVKNLVLIYDLLRRRKFTIEGAKDYLKRNKNAEEKFAMIQSLQQIRTFLLEMKASL